MPQSSVRQFRVPQDQVVAVFASSTTCGTSSGTRTIECRCRRLINLATEANQRLPDLDQRRARRHTLYSSATTNIAVRGTTAAQIIGVGRPENETAVNHQTFLNVYASRQFSPMKKCERCVLV
jgi:hypothetical protein